MGVGKKLNLSFVALIVLLTLSIGSSLFSLVRINQQVEEALDYRLEQLLYVANIRNRSGLVSSYMRAVILEPDEAIHREHLDTSSKELAENLEALGKMVHSSEFKGYWETAVSEKEKFNQVMPEILRLVDSGETEEATEIVNTQMQDINTEMMNVAQKMIQFQTDQMNEINDEVSTTVRWSTILSAVILVFSIGASVALILYVRRSIVLPLKQVIAVAKDFGEGNLATQDIAVATNDEIGELASIFNASKHTMRSLIVTIQGSAETLNGSSQELSASAEEVLATTEEVAHQANDTSDIAQGSASAANESSLAMDETAQGIQRIAEATQVLFDSSNATNELATNGTNVVHQARQQMTNINQSTISVNQLVQKLAKETEEIESIVTIITNLTDQTNLLALNATIEAARAGEQGKGFLVVADEVRKLAEESKQSATSITKLTTEIKNDTKTVAQAMATTLPAVEKGVEVITDAGDSFEAIVGAVHEMTNQIQDISTTSEELSASAEEVSASVSEIATGSHVTSDNIEAIAASMNEQSETINDVATVAMSLSQTAQSLQEETRKFKV